MRKNDKKAERDGKVLQVTKYFRPIGSYRLEVVSSRRIDSNEQGNEENSNATQAPEISKVLLTQGFDISM